MVHFLKVYTCQNLSFFANTATPITVKTEWNHQCIFILTFYLHSRYGGSPAIPRQVIRNYRGDIELELHPLSLKLYKHQTIPRQTNHVPTVVGGYSAAAISATGAVAHGFGSTAPPSTTRRYHAHNAAFSRRTTVFTIEEFLCQRFSTKSEDLRYRFNQNKLNGFLTADCSCTTKYFWKNSYRSL